MPCGRQTATGETAERRDSTIWGASDGGRQPTTDDSSGCWSQVGRRQENGRPRPGLGSRWRDARVTVICRRVMIWMNGLKHLHGNYDFTKVAVLGEQGTQLEPASLSSRQEIL
jgi:hypothetical protein